MASTTRTERTGVARGFRIPPRDAVNILAENSHLAANLVDAFVVDTTSRPDLSPDAVRRWLGHRIDHAAVFRRRARRRRFDLGDPFWVPATPDLSRAVTVLPSRGPGWQPVGEMVAEILSTPIDLAELVWQLTVITGVRDVPGLPEQACVFVLKIHHAAMDGLGIAALMRALFSDAPFVERRVAGTDEEPVPGVAGELLGLPARLMTLGGVLLRRRVNRREPVFALPRTGPTSCRQPGPPVVRVVWFDLDEMRAALRDRPVHVTVNDAVLAVVSVALGGWLHGRGSDPTSLTAIVPMDIGELRDNGAANKTTFVSVDLHTQILDTTARMVAIHQDMVSLRARAAKHESTATDPDPADILPAVISRVMATLGHRLTPAKDRLDLTIVSNIPHPPGAVAYAGAPVVGAFHPLPPGGGIAVAHNVTSVGHRLGLTVTAAPGALPDPDAYASRLRAAIGLLGVEAL